MNGRTHTAVGLAAGATAASILMPDSVSLTTFVLGSAAATVASTLPDCDQFKNDMPMTIRCLIKLAAFCLLAQWMTEITVNWQYVMFMTLAILVGAMTEHRTVTHSIFATLGFSWLCHTVIVENEVITLWFFVAYASHLVLDVLNKRGEMLFWPFYRKRYCLRISKSESWLGKLILKVAAVWYLVMCCTILMQMI